MCKCNNEIKVDESYVTFKNINCFENACAVVDNLLRLIKEPANSNEYWEKFVSRIPEAYYARDAKQDPKEELLYLVCSTAAIIGEFFENTGDEDAMYALEKCESECC